jgi:hypothetical protein
LPHWPFLSARVFTISTRAAEMTGRPIVAHREAAREFPTIRSEQALSSNKAPLSLPIRARDDSHHGSGFGVMRQAHETSFFGDSQRQSKQWEYFPRFRALRLLKGRTSTNRVYDATRRPKILDMIPL